jgi:hypothetical protein
VARHLCQVGVVPRSVPALRDVVAAGFDVRLSEPTNSRAPWLLDVVPR